MNPTDPIVLRVVRRFEASPERVFDAWLQPATARRFLFATAAGEMQKVEIDARVGGGFVIVERRGEELAEHYGIYLEIDRPRRLVFAFSTEKPDPDGSLVTIDIVPHGSGCELTLTHRMAPEWKDYAERTQAGWTNILEGLARVLDAAQAPETSS
jgi:uncharacterized protein YndB with AHSA1/START domain